MARSRTRRRILIALVVLCLLGVCAGFLYVWQRGRKRTDPYRQAFAAHETGDAAAAERGLREILATDASHVRARALLVQILAEGGRVQEAEELAKAWLLAPETELLGYRTLSELAFRRTDTTTALRYARMAAEGDPAFSQEMQAHIRDVLGTPGDREASARAAETFAMLAKSPAARAGAFLYAAETLRDLGRLLPEGALRKAVAERQELDRRAAREASSHALQAHAGAGNPMTQGLSPEARGMSGRIKLLAPEAEERQQGLEQLEALLEAHPDTHHARASLVSHLIAEGKASQAATHAGRLKDAPLLLSVRSILALAGAGERVAALGVLEALQGRLGELSGFLKARIQVAGEGAEREEGLRAYEALAKAHPKEAPIVEEAYRQVQRFGGRERGLALLAAVAALEPQFQPMALLEKTVAAVESSGPGAAEGALAELAGGAGEADLLVLHGRLSQIPKVGEEAAWAFLEQVLRAGKVEAGAVRVLRAAIAASRSGTAPDGRTWGQVARDDVEAVAGDEKASARTVLRAGLLATALGEPRLQGRLLGRALADPEAGDGAHPHFLRAVADTDDGNRDLIAQGLREASARLPEAQAWLGLLAEALAAGDVAKVRRKSTEPARQGKPLEANESDLQLLLAVQAGDWPEVEAFARHILATWPERPRGKERLGLALLAAGKREEVLALHGATTRELIPRLQRIEALVGLKRQTDALTEARALVRESEGSDQALHALARILRDVDPDAALAAISSVGGGSPVELLRAELLERRGEEDAAVQTYERMLEVSGQRNLGSWRGLARVRSAQGRDLDFVRRISPVIEAPPRGMAPAELAQLLLLRGQANEHRGAYEPALADYRRTLDLLPKDPIALNNAAWLLGSRLVPRDPTKPDPKTEALALVERAVEVAPNVAQVHHTRAKILTSLAQREEALKALERALALTTAALTPERTSGARASTLEALRTRLATYLFDQGTLLEDLGQKDAAAAVYARIRDEHAGTHQAQKAADSLGRLGR